MALNPKQQEAVTTPGIQLVLAGPGSGKTRVITEKILHLIKEKGVRPEEILALTFSEKAAAEMEERLREQMDTSRLMVATFHSFCFEILQDNMLETGISFSSGLISRTNQLVWGVQNIDTFGFESIEIGNNAPMVIESIIDGISRFRDELITPDDLESYLEAKACANPDEEEQGYLGRLSDLLRVYRAYEEYKRSMMLIDFDDMIHEAVLLFRNKPGIRRNYQNRYRYILVDEFQDTNFAQLALVKLIAGEHLCIVGDDDQSIYRFRGAYDGNVDEFTAHFPDHAVVVLEENYRNPATILTLARQLMEHAPGSSTKNLIPKKSVGNPVIVAECANETLEAAYAADEIETLLKQGYRPEEIAILCRKRAQGEKFFESLKSRQIPCTFPGEVAFFSIPAVRDVVACLKAIANPLRSGIPFNRMMRRAGVPETAIRQINVRASSLAKDREGDDGVFRAMQECIDIGEPEAVPIGEIAATSERLAAEKEELTLPSLVRNIMLRTGRRHWNRADDRQAVTALNRLYDIAQEFSRINREGDLDAFLEHLDMLKRTGIDLEPDEREQEGVRIMTVHQSKGKEFPAVFIADLSERKFPLDFRSKPFYVPHDLTRGVKAGADEKELYLQEERRLLYVAMTRSQDRLYLVRAKQYGDNKREAKPSRFLTEIGYRTNPNISVISVDGAGGGAAGVLLAGTDPDTPEETLKRQAIEAIADGRLSTAVQKILGLAYISSETEGEAFDAKQFLDVPFDSSDLKRMGGDVPLIRSKDDLALSASALRTYQDCPLKFKFEKILRIPGEPRTYFNLGTALHAVAEHLTKRKMAGIEPTAETGRELLDRFWLSEPYRSKKQEEEDRTKAVAYLDNYLIWEAANPNTPLETEMKFEIAVNGIRFTGYIDRLEQTPEGGYVVVDFKTSKTSIPASRAHEDIQLNLYTLAVREQFGCLPERVSLCYLSRGKEVHYLPNEESVNAFLDSAGELLDGIIAGEFPARESYACRFCDYSMLCGDEPRQY